MYWVITSYSRSTAEGTQYGYFVHAMPDDMSKRISPIIDFDNPSELLYFLRVNGHPVYASTGGLYDWFRMCGIPLKKPHINKPLLGE